MTRLAARRTTSINRTAGRGDTAAVWPWLTRAAFAVAVAVVVARLTTNDAVRDPFAAAPGGTPPGRSLAAGTSLALDLLSAVPALLVLARRALDPTYRLVGRFSHAVLLALTAWMAVTVGWASDRLAAVVGVGAFAAAGSLLWAGSQLVRSWAQFRVVAGVGLGLLVGLAVHTALYRMIDVPEMRTFWAEQRADFLRQRGWAADSFFAHQYDRRMQTGEQMGWYNSANTLGAVGVLLLFAGGAIGVQRWADDRDPRWGTLTAVAAAAAGWVLSVANSKTAAVTPVLGVGLLGGYALARDRLRRQPTVAFWAGVGLVTTGLVAVVALGLAKHGLLPGHFSNSLDFRWKYWTAAAGVVGDHPFRGVGWANFGRAYLAHRRPEAAEEITDPHNLLVRFAAESGVVGLVLVVLWLLRLAWELTRPAVVPETDARPLHVGTVAWMAGLGIAIQMVASLDPSGSALGTAMAVLRTGLVATAVMIGGVAATARSATDTAVDGRPAPWVLAATVVGLGLFTLHGLIDFGWFEAGPASAFMLLAGSALGLTATPAGRPLPRAWAVGGLAVAVVAWAAVALAVAVPVGLAAAAAGSADDQVRAADPKDPTAVAVAYRQASAGYAEAAADVPYDGEMWARAAGAAIRGGDAGHARQWAAAAVAADPALVEARLLSAGSAVHDGDGRLARSSFDAAVRLAPTDVPIRLRYAEALDQLGDHAAAVAQYRAALAADAALPPDEPRRLSPTRLAEIKHHIAG